jgi:rubrerythrin
MHQSLRDVIRIGIEKEHEAYVLYITLARDPKLVSIKKIFSMLAVQELRHERLLNKIQDTGDFARAKEESAQEYEKELDILKAIDSDTSIVDAASGIALAIKREQKAYEAYMKLASQADPEVREIFESLANEELHHREILEDVIEKIVSQ